MEDSPGQKAWAFLEGGALRVDLGYGEDGRTGPTLVLYLCGVGVAATEAWGATTASTGPTTRRPWAAAMVAEGAGTAAVTVVVGDAAVMAARPGLEPPAGGGQDYLTLGRKLCPPCVFTMAGLEKDRRWRGWEDEGFQK